MQIVGKNPSLLLKERSDMQNKRFLSEGEEFDWLELDTDLYHWTKSLRPVQV